MKRRKFVQGLLAAPTVPAVLGAAQAPPPVAPAQQQQPQPQANTPARQEPRQPPAVPNLELTAVDKSAEPAPHYFDPVRFATLQKLGAILVPPLKNNPGAIEAQAPEFLDFLISVSPAARQRTYNFGLDQLEARAKEKFQKSFCDIEPAQANAIVQPLMVARPWPEDLPSDPLQGFMAQVHEDLRNATQNSREWADAIEKSGHHFTRGYRGTGYYWFPIDPISQS